MRCKAGRHHFDWSRPCYDSTGHKKTWPSGDRYNIDGEEVTVASNLTPPPNRVPFPTPHFGLGKSVYPRQIRFTLFSAAVNSVVEAESAQASAGDTAVVDNSEKEAGCIDAEPRKPKRLAYAWTRTCLVKLLINYGTHKFFFPWRVLASSSFHLPRVFLIPIMPSDDKSDEKLFHEAVLESPSIQPDVQVLQPEDPASVEERRLVRKIDRRILPIACLMYLFACQ